MKSLFKLFFITLIITISSFSVTIYAQETTTDLQTVIVDTVKRTARTQAEKVIQEGTQKTLDTAAATGKKLDETYSGKSITWLQEKTPFIHNKIYLPIDALRVKQSNILQSMITIRNSSPDSVPAGVQKVTETLNTKRGFFTETQLTDDEPGRVSASTESINQAVIDTSIDPTQTLGKTYTMFLKLLGIIFSSRILFYSLLLLVIFSIISRVLHMRTSE